MAIPKRYTLTMLLSHGMKKSKKRRKRRLNGGYGERMAKFLCRSYHQDEDFTSHIHAKDYVKTCGHIASAEAKLSSSETKEF